MTIHARTRPMHDVEALMQAFGPQLGEMIWHSVHYDPNIATVVSAQAADMRRLVEQHGLHKAGYPLRVLEVGAYSHWTAHAVAEEFGGTGVTHDIAPAALRQGARLGHEHGVKAQGVMVATDFHALPYADNHFDLVFIASAIHHTFRPWVVIAELLRVLRPGGVLRVANEPVGRRLCLYQFRGNRAESHTPYEARLQALGLMATVCSPFPGSRPETLFGMIENDRIPLDMYLDAFGRGAEVVELSLVHSYLDGAFERSILALPRGPELERDLHDLLAAPIEEAAMAFGPRDAALGFSVPDRDQIWSLSYAAAPLIRALPPEGSAERAGAITRLLGGALAATVRKAGAPGRGGGEFAKLVHGVARLFRGGGTQPMFNRHLEPVDGVFLDAAPAGATRLNLATPLLPAIRAEEAEALARIYPPGAWQLTQETAGMSLVLAGASGTAFLPDPFPEALALLRYYAVCPGAPYALEFLVDGRLVASLVVAQTESQLARFVIPAGTRQLEIRCVEPGGALADVAGAIRLNPVLVFPLAM